jgi:hypothetical protein
MAMRHDGGCNSFAQDIGDGHHELFPNGEKIPADCPFFLNMKG